MRTVVGEMSSVDFRGLGSCRVHIFLRVADAPARDPRSSEKPRSTVATAAAAAAAALSIAGVSDENNTVRRNLYTRGVGYFVQTGLGMMCLDNVPPLSYDESIIGDNRECFSGIPLL